MRQRKVKNVEERLSLYTGCLIENPTLLKGAWHKAFQEESPIFLELGCGKGQFVRAQALAHPSVNYIGVEGQPTVALRAVEKAAETEMKNLRFVTGFVRDMTDYFAEGELSGIYLNFSDPWPKKKHAKRRLTHKSYLEGYRAVSKEGAVLECKTDNLGLFDYTLEQVALMKLEVLEISHDLADSQWESRHITTEYEDKFKAEGKKIHYVKVKLK